MQKQHANTDFSSVPLAELSSTAHQIVSLMTTNVAIYPAPTTPLGAVTTSITKYDSIIALPEYIGKTGDLKNARAALETALNSNGKYVNSVAKGDLAMLEKSGYPLSKPHSPVGNLPKPVSVLVKGGDAPGSFDLNIGVVEKAKGYLFAFAPVTNATTDPNNWTIRWSAKHTNTFDGFTSGAQYKFAACAVGSTNNVFWTNAPTNLFAQ